MALPFIPTVIHTCCCAVRVTTWFPEVKDEAASWDGPVSATIWTLLVPGSKGGIWENHQADSHENIRQGGWEISWYYNMHLQWWLCGQPHGTRRFKQVGSQQWLTEGETPPPAKFQRPSKIVPNSTWLWRLLKIAEFRMPTPQDVRKKGSKILKLPRFAIVLH